MDSRYILDHMYVQRQMAVYGRLLFDQSAFQLWASGHRFQPVPTCEIPGRIRGSCCRSSHAEQLHTHFHMARLEWMVRQWSMDPSPLESVVRILAPELLGLAPSRTWISGPLVCLRTKVSCRLRPTALPDCRLWGLRWTRTVHCRGTWATEDRLPPGVFRPSGRTSSTISRRIETGVARFRPTGGNFSRHSNKTGVCSATSEVANWKILDEKWDLLWCDLLLLLLLLWPRTHSLLLLLLLLLRVGGTGVTAALLIRTHSFVFLLSTKPAEPSSALSSQKRQDVFLDSFWVSSFHSRTLLQATLVAPEWHHCQCPWMILKVTFAVWNLSSSHTSWNIARICYHSSSRVTSAVAALLVFKQPKPAYSYKKK